MQTIRESTGYIVKVVNRKLMAHFGLYTLTTGILPFLYVLFLERMTAVVTEGTTFIGELLFFTLLIAVFNALAIYSQSKADNMMTRCRMDIVAKVNAKVLEMPYRQVEDEAFLSAHHRVFGALDSSETGFEKVCHLLFRLPGLLIGYGMLIVVLAERHMGWGTIAALLVLTGVQVVESLQVTRHRLACDAEKIAAERQLDDLFEAGSAFASGKEIRLYQLQPFLEEKAAAATERLEGVLKAVTRFQRRAMIPRAILCLGILAAFYTTMTAQVALGHIGLSAVAMLIATLFQLLVLNQKIADDFKVLYFESDAVAALKAFATEAETTAETPKEAPAILEVENLWYRYKNSTDWVLKDINLKIVEGEKVAIVGLNGAGKSTLIKCISGLYDDYKGSIKWRGQELKEADQSWVAGQMKVLFQDVKPYPFSIRENIAGADVDTDDAICEALKAMALEDKVMGLSEGLKTHVGTIFDADGIQFSGGEAQRLAFARMLYHNPQLVILDEPTSALDSFSEKRLFDKIDVALKARTCLFVTHRLHNVQQVHRIAVMQNGSIVESGTHGALMTQGGVYGNLFTLQQQYYKDKCDDDSIEKII